MTLEASTIAHVSRTPGPVAIAALLLTASCSDTGATREERALPDASVPWDPSEDVVLAAAPALSEDVFPCTDCHDPELPFNPKPRELLMAHDHVVLDHYEGGWCMDCHDGTDRDSLHSAGGTRTSFDERHRLCGQCHPRHLADWERGSHGKLAGSGNGQRTALSCAHCHDAHTPRFAPLEPMPGPTPPQEAR